MIVPIAILAVLFMMVGHWYRRKSGLPPGPRGVPVLGVMPFLGKQPAILLRDWTKKYGFVYTVRMGQVDYVILNDYDTIHQVYIKQADKAVGKAPLFIFDQMSKGGGVIFANQRVWKLSRPFSVQTLRRLGMGKKILETRVQEEAQSFVQALRVKDGSIFDFKEMIFCAVTNIIISVTLGDRYEDYDDKELRELVHRITRGWQEDGGPIMMMGYCYWLQMLPVFFGAFNRLKRDQDRLFEILRKKIKDHSTSYDENEIRDFIDAFLKEIKKENHDRTFNETQLVTLVKDLLDGGSHTASSVLVWCILALVKYPEYQRKLRKEVDAVVGTANAVCMHHRESMPRTLAFIYETMRVCTILPFSHMKTIAETHVNGYTIPKNTALYANLWAVHNNPKYFKDPSTFMPERFIDANDGTFVKSRYWMPFSVGKRNCLGEPLAHMEIFIFLANLVQNFDIEPVDENELPSLDDGEPGVFYIANEFQVRFLLRKDD